jgi:hypothetical protein
MGNGTKSRVEGSLGRGLWIVG